MAIQKEILEDVYYPIFVWKHVIMNYGGYVFMRKSNPNRKSFIITSTAITLYDIVFLSLSIYTLVLTSFDKDIFIQIALNTFFWLPMTMVNFIVSAVYSKLLEGDEMLKSGVYLYETSDIGENDIRRKTVERIRFLFVLFSRIVWFTLALIVIILPLVKILLVPKDERSMSLVDPYLPQPVYMPFRTDNRFGYIMAVIFLGLSSVFSFASAIFNMAIVLSCTLQLCGQFEVLIFSVQNIAKRAYMKLIEKNLGYSTLSIEDVHMLPEFHVCLYSCLRENILHHQAILR